MLVNSAHGSNAEGIALASLIANEAAGDRTRFEYLFQLAKRESNLNPEARAATSSAYGLFQFIDETWLNLIDQYNDQVNLPTGPSTASAALSKNEDAAVLALRADPAISVRMASILTDQNERILEESLGRMPTPAELYFAHFMGPSGATKLIKAEGSEIAADLFSTAARANRSIFFDGDMARTVDEVRSILSRGFQVPAKEGFSHPQEATKSRSYTPKKIQHEEFTSFRYDNIALQEILIYSVILEFINKEEEDF